jgi:hypothetical protein
MLQDSQENFLFLWFFAALESHNDNRWNFRRETNANAGIGSGFDTHACSPRSNKLACVWSGTCVVCAIMPPCKHNMCRKWQSKSSWFEWRADLEYKIIRCIFEIYIEPDVRLHTLGTRVRWCEALLVTHTQQLLVFQIMRFCERHSCCTLENWGKKKSPTPYVYYVPRSNFIMFGGIDKWRD